MEVGNSWAFDASVCAGSGVIAVCGPPCSGKTQSVLKYLINRRASTNVSGNCAVIHCSAKMVNPGELREAVVMELYAPSLKRRISSLSIQTFGFYVAHYAQNLPQNSELHVVVDDVDAKAVDENGVLEWADECMSQAGEGSKSTILFWIVSQKPLPLPTCRFHFMTRQPPVIIKKWLASVSEKCSDAVIYYMTRNPTALSIVAHDFRTLLQHVAMLVIPHLPSAPNPLDYAVAWKKAAEVAGATLHASTSSSQASVVVSSLNQLGPSAQILFVACFYCGCVPPGKDAQILFDGQTKTTKRAQLPGGPAGALSSRAQVFSASRVEQVFAKFGPLCVDVGPLLPCALAMHHLTTFIAWGAVVHVTNCRDKFHCTIAESNALEVSRALGFRLHDVIK